jgi:hypothetical protein
MDCQSGCPLTGLITAICEQPICIRHALSRAVPQCGQREDQSCAKILVSTKTAMILVWPKECSLQKVHARPRTAPDSEVKR